MTNRELWVLALGGALVGVALVALNFPVYIDVFDQFGTRIACGNGYGSNLLQAQAASEAVQNANYVSECQSALAARRTWTIPVAVVGWLIISGLLVEFWLHAPKPHKDAENTHI